MITLHRSETNPIIAPSDREWEKISTFNPAAFYLKGKIYILYRALSSSFVSSIGLAISTDGFTIDERLEEPIYTPRYSFEKNITGKEKVYTGIEDPMVTIIDNVIYMTYTAVSDVMPYVRVALTRIRVKDFLKERWDRWSRPFLISEPAIWDKDAAFIRVKDDLYLLYHRIDPDMWVSFFRSKWPEQEGWKLGIPIYRKGRENWEAVKVGIGPPPILTEDGWLAIYHAIGADWAYRAGAMLLHEDYPWVVERTLDHPILEPEAPYEREALSKNVVFPTGMVLLGDDLFVYYGAADTYVGVATVDINDLLSELVGKQ